MPLPYLTSVRGLAALAVLLFHCDWFPYGYLGVDVFFVLSGYLLTWGQVHRPRSTIEFWVARLKRTVPTHIVSTVIVGCFIVGVLRARAPSTLVSNLLLLPVLDAPRTAIVNPPTWSLVVEWLAYLAFPALLVPVRSLPRVVAVLAALLVSGSLYWYTPDAWINGICRGIGEFVLGTALAITGWEPKRITAMCWLESKPLRWLGDISYPVYLIQALPLYLAYGPGWALHHTMERSLMVFTSTLVLGWVLHIAVERPCMITASRVST